MTSAEELLARARPDLIEEAAEESTAEIDEEPVYNRAERRRRAALLRKQTRQTRHNIASTGKFARARGRARRRHVH